jgi:DNA-binding CsgD family transcriptional regulator
MEIAGPLSRLSQRERQVLDLVVSGKSSGQIAQQLAISPKSVDTYRGRLMSKIGVNNLPGLMSFALDHGLMQEGVP